MTATTDTAARPAVATQVREQPVAPYLDAVMAYAFRGTARDHVPGYKGGPGADPGVIKAIGIDTLAADVPQLIHGIEGIRLVDASLVGRPRIAGYDALRIVLDVRGTGCTGYELADALRRSYDVHLELPAHATIVFVVGLRESTAALRRLAGDIEESVNRIAKPGTTAAIVGPAKMLLGGMAVPPREAFLGHAAQVPVSAAAGPISCESIASYPPGVPQLLPGEPITDEKVAHLSSRAVTGARLHGASDPNFKRINVLMQEEG